ncbi:MAG: argininosuccinate lyase [Chloroflexota bacterium]
MTLWGGRFSTKLDSLAWDLNTSLGFDRRMAQQDVRASIAWARAIAAAGVLTTEECEQVCAGLRAIGDEFGTGTFVFQPSDEDIHTAVERRLGEIVGPAAGKLHTGRSRNDQVATDFRLWVLDHLPALEAAVQDMQTALVERAETDFGLLMPGYTHLQRAQPILLSHWWLSHFWPLQRDRQRLADLRRRVAVMPLGCGALAGCPFSIDRDALAGDLGFDLPAHNSLDAVSDRDFAAEFLFCTSLIGVHLGKLSEAMVLFTTTEFGFFELSDAYSTGSSLMPQKKNPDLFELARGKAGTLLGLLSGMLATLKGLPSTYDKDLQEDKPPVFAAFDTLTMILPVLAGALRTLAVKPARLRAGIDPAMLATDLADYLVERGVPFREAHALAGKSVRLAAEKGVPLDQLSTEEYQSLHPTFGPDVHQVFDPAQSVTRRKAIGGTAPEAVQVQCQQAKAFLHRTPYDPSNPIPLI